MKINQILRLKMTEYQLKQKDIAEKLGLTTAAVSKWANGLSYPDITLLPALARLLNIDVNTLLSFHEELSPQEVADFVNQLSQTGKHTGTAQAFQQAKNMIQQYPTCHLLLLNAATVLDGLSFMYEKTVNPDHLAEIEDWYTRAAQSDQPDIVSQATAQLIGRHLRREEYEKAQALLDNLPAESTFDRQQLQATLYAQQGNWNEAAKLTEIMILKDAANIQSSLQLLAEAAIQEDNPEALNHIVNVGEQFVQLMDSHALTALSLRLKQAIFREDQEMFLQTFREIFQLLQKPWSHNDSLLYRHLPNKELDPRFGQTLTIKINDDLENPENHEFDFVRDHPAFQALIADFKAEFSE